MYHVTIVNLTTALNSVPRRWVDDAVELVVGHGLRVEVVEHGLLLQVLISAEQSLPHLTLSRSGISNCKRECMERASAFLVSLHPPDFTYEDGVSHVEQLVQLHDLQHEALLRL